ncbi:hypothetical protein ACEPAH_123 [Sanghuangporus vaninii]
MIYPNVKRVVLYILLSLFSTSLQLVSAHDNGMDMSMDGSMNLASGNMLPYLHFTSGDILWFQGWVPGKAGPMVGACIGLFLLAVFDRWLSAYRGLIDSHWYRQAKISLARKTDVNNNSSNTTAPHSQHETRPSVSSESSIAVAKLAATAPPNLPDNNNNTRSKHTALQSHWFIRDIPRGIVQAAQSALEFAFMLVIMTFQVGFIISIAVGLGVGEAMFGRYHPQAHLYY